MFLDLCKVLDLYLGVFDLGSDALPYNLGFCLIFRGLGLIFLISGLILGFLDLSFGVLDLYFGVLDL